MMMTKTDLRQFKAIQRHLDEKATVHSLHIRASAYERPEKTHGGPVFMSVGQVIQLDVVGESKRLLAGDDGTDAPADSSAPTASDAAAGASAAPVNATDTPPAADSPAVTAAS
jgi:hypothetical protein